MPDLLTAALDDPDSATPEDIPPDTPANRQRGWARMALQILFLGPTRFSTFKLVERRLLVSPVIQTFVYSKARNEREWVDAALIADGRRCNVMYGRVIAVCIGAHAYTRSALLQHPSHHQSNNRRQVPESLVEFVDRITARWAFTSVLPAHFNAPARATPRELQSAFAFAYDLVGTRPRTPAAAGAVGIGFPDLFAALLGGGGVGGVGKPVEYPEDDMEVLRFVNDFIKKAGVASK